jgi:AhpD family alkylhydroperoxidase
MKATSAAGALDERTKELIHFTLSVMSRCGPCVVAHLKKARGMGIKQEQLDEAAWCAIAMGGAPVKMFYEQALRDEKGGGATGRRS